MSFRERLQQATERGQQHRNEEARRAAAQALSEEECRRLHSDYRLILTDHIEACLKQLAENFPGFRYETIVDEILVPESQSPPLPPDDRLRLLESTAHGRLLLEVSRLSPLEFVDTEFEHPAIRAGLLSRPKNLLTRHLSTNVMIEVEGRDAASGLSYLTMISTTPAADAGPPFVSQGPIWFGEMKDRFVRENGAWKFLERRGSIQMKFSA